MPLGEKAIKINGFRMITKDKKENKNAYFKHFSDEYGQKNTVRM